MKKELRILMLEDLEEDAGLLDRVLAKERVSFSRMRVDTREEFIEALFTFKPDLILSDHALPQFNSIEALRITQEKKIDVPFIIVTGTVSEEFAVTCLKKGADDYVLKSNLSRLPSAISHSLNERQYLKDRKEQEQIIVKNNQELIKINEELDSFVYSLSHSLRSPVASIIGVVGLAKSEHAGNRENIDSYIGLIEKSAFRLDETLRELLDYSQNFRNELQLSELDFEAIVEESFSSLHALPGFKTFKKQIDIHKESSFFSDRSRLCVLVTNLLSNSIKFRDPGKSNSFINITATISPRAATISIYDNGVGIHPDYLDRVFKMFFRANEKSDGAGLGLFIAKEIVDKLNGSIEITSEYQQWTRVDISLPNFKS